MLGSRGERLYIQLNNSSVDSDKENPSCPYFPSEEFKVYRWNSLLPFKGICRSVCKDSLRLKKETVHAARSSILMDSAGNYGSDSRSGVLA